MAAREVITYPDERLRQKAQPVTCFDEELSSLVDDLFDTLYASPGIGFCAPQIGLPLQIIVADHSGNGTAPEVYINPKILGRSRIGIIEESCLSVPGMVAKVMRATRVRVRAQSRRGDMFERDLVDMPAVCVEHEMDHLRGILFVDRLKWIGRWKWRRHLKRQQSLN